jgi:hypothetical protein
MENFIESFFSELEKIAEIPGVVSTIKSPSIGKPEAPPNKYLDFMKKHQQQLIMVGDDFIPIIARSFSKK